jgi:hypothetical protein
MLEDRMSITAMKQALDALEECRRDPRLKYEHSFYDKTITALRTAIAEAESVEPVAYAVVGDGQWGEWLIGDQFETSKPPKHKYWENRGYELVPLYTPLAAQRQWVGLTDEDRQACAQSPFVWENYLAIEAKLKEKNT